MKFMEKHSLKPINVLSLFLASALLTGCGSGSSDQTPSTTWRGLAAPTTVSGAADLFPALAAGDVTGDGKNDLVTIQINVNEAGIFPGNGDGTFGARIPLALSVKPRAVAVVDVNQDAKPDLIVAGGVGEAGEIAIYRSLGNGAFSAPTTIPVEFAVRQIAVADFNRDGIRDFVVLSYIPAPLTVATFEGDGTGNFTRRYTNSAEANPTDLAVADVNGDGKDDILAIGEQDTNILVLYTGNSDGTFATPQQFGSLAEPPFGTDGTSCLTAADITGDGKADVITGHSVNYEMVAVRPTVGSAAGGVSFGEAIRITTGGPFDVAAADLNRDGQMDIVASNNAYSTVSYLLNRAAGFFNPPTPVSVGPLPTGLLLADFNGDTYPDLAVISGLNMGLSVRLNRGKP